MLKNARKQVASRDDSSAPIAVAEIRDRIWLAIAGRKLNPGTRLKEEELSEVFGVSRARIRSVLTELQREGLVTLQANRGAFVAAPSAEDAADVFHVRRMVETRIVERLAPVITAEGLDELRELVKAEAEAIATSDQSEIIRLSGAFHLRLAELLDSEFLVSIMRVLIGRSSLVTAIYRANHDVHCGPGDHRHLIEALSKGDGEAVAQMMVTHIDVLENELELGLAREVRQDLHSIFA